MTQTYSLTTVRNLLVVFAFCALALCAYTPHASAHGGGHDDESATSSESLGKESKRLSGGSLDTRSARSIEKKIKQVEKKLAALNKKVEEYEALLARLKEAASSTPSGTGSSTSQSAGVRASVKETRTTDTTPTLTGKARGVTSLSLTIETVAGVEEYESGSSTIAVTDGAWSHTVADELAVGKHKVLLYSPSDTLVGSGFITIKPATGSSTVLGAETVSLGEVLNQLASVLIAIRSQL